MVLSTYKGDRHPKPQPNSAIDVGAGLRINFHPHQQPKSTRPDAPLKSINIDCRLGWNDSGNPTFINALLGFAVAQPNLRLLLKEGYYRGIRDRHPKPPPNSAIDLGAGLGINFHPHQQPKSTRPDYRSTFQ